MPKLENSFPSPDEEEEGVIPLTELSSVENVVRFNGEEIRHLHGQETDFSASFEVPVIDSFSSVYGNQAEAFMQSHGGESYEFVTNVTHFTYTDENQHARVYFNCWDDEHSRRESIQAISVSLQGSPLLGWRFDRMVRSVSSSCCDECQISGNLNACHRRLSKSTGDLPATELSLVLGMHPSLATVTTTSESTPSNGESGEDAAAVNHPVSGRQNVDGEAVGGQGEGSVVERMNVLLEEME